MARMAGLLAALVLLAAISVAQGGDRSALNEVERAVHVLSRFAFGPRPGEVERVVEMGAEAWIEAQLEAAPDEALDDRLGSLRTLGMESAEVYDVYGRGIPSGASREERRRIQLLNRTPRDELSAAIVLRALHGQNQLEEVLCDFWRNHFNVSYTKGGSALWLLTEWERVVIREHALGRFDEMLFASARHPAMLHYLDNASSRRPPTSQELSEIERRVRKETDSRKAGKEAAELALQRGLNENYARELLELHTLGVDNYYRQKDVVAAAEVLTGWTWRGGKKGDWKFAFRDDMHVRGSKRFLNQRIQGEWDQGRLEGEELLRLLAAHQGTSRFVASKLVRYVVADDPPRKLVDRVARAFRKTDGDVRAMVRAIVESEEFWAREAFRGKFKTPLEFALSALRVTGARVESPQTVFERLAQMGQPIYHCDDPTGYYDTAEAWLDPGVLALRWQFAMDLARGRLEGIEVPAAFWADLPDELPPALRHHPLARRVLPGGIGERTRAALGRVADAWQAEHPEGGDRSELRARLLGLLLGSPEFQRQ